MKVVLGPIIGFVDETNARIMVEVSKSGEIECVLKNHDKNVDFKQSAYVDGNIPFVFNFHELNVNEEYIKILKTTKLITFIP